MPDILTACMALHFQVMHSFNKEDVNVPGLGVRQCGDLS